MKYLGYHIKIVFDKEAEGYVGTISGIDDVITCFGRSKIDCKQNAIEMVDDYIQMCKEIGKDPETPHTKIF